MGLFTKNQKHRDNLKSEDSQFLSFGVSEKKRDKISDPKKIWIFCCYIIAVNTGWINADFAVL